MAKTIEQRTAQIMAKELGLSQAKYGDLISGLKELKNEHYEARKRGFVSTIQEFFEKCEIDAMKRIAKEYKKANK